MTRHQPATLAARLKLGAANAARIARAQALHPRSCAGTASAGTCSCYVLPLLEDLDGLKLLAGELFAIFKAGDWPGALPVDPRAGDRLTRGDGSIFTFGPAAGGVSGWTRAHGPLTRQEGQGDLWGEAEAPEEDPHG